MIDRRPFAAPPLGASLKASCPMDRYSELRARAAEFVAEWVHWGAVLVLAPVREAADEVALAACGDPLQRPVFQPLPVHHEAGGCNVYRKSVLPVSRT